MHGIHLGIGAITPDGGTYIPAGHTTGIGTDAIHGIIITTGALSVPVVISATVIMSYTAA